MEPNDLVVPESSSSRSKNGSVTAGDGTITDQNNHQLHDHQPLSRKSLLSPSVKQARLEWKNGSRNSMRSSLSSIPGVTHVVATNTTDSSPRQRQRRVSGLRRSSQGQEGSEGYQKFRINTINVIIDDNEEGDDDVEIAQTETTTTPEDSINVSIDDGDDEEQQGRQQEEEDINVPPAPSSSASLATTLVEAHLVSDDLEGQEESSSSTDASKAAEKEDPILIQDAVPLKKSPWFRRGRIFTTIVMFAVLIILIIIVVITLVTVKVDNVQQQTTASSNSNANNNEPNIFDANNNRTGSCPTSFNNVESTCALFLNGMSDKDRTECQCMNFCNGAYVGCQDDSEQQQQQQHFSCSGSAVAGCKSSIPPITLLLDAQKLDSLTLLALTDPESPQSQAYHWLEEHPQVHDMTEDRKLQLFALATLYKSTQPWDEHALEQWMDYDINECDWMTRNVNTPSRIWEYGSDCTTTLDEGYYQSIDIDEAGLDGILPLELYLLTHLSYISLWSNNLRGTISSEIGLLTQLTHLHFLTGTLPTELGLLTKLTYLDVQTNGLKGTLPSQIGSLTELTLLWLHNNNLSGELPTQQLAKLTKLNEIEIYDNQLSGSLPESFCYDFPYWTTGITVDCAGKTAKCPPCPNDFTKCHCK